MTSIYNLILLSCKTDQERSWWRKISWFFRVFIKPWSFICASWFKKSTPPKILLLNARSIANKLVELQAYAWISTFKPGLICVTETWLTSQILDSDLLVAGYLLMRNGREHKKGGGVCSWRHNSFSPLMLTPFYDKPNCIECLMFSLSSCDILYIGIMHCSVYSSCVIGGGTFLSSQLDTWLESNPDQTLLITGDFNDFSTVFWT